MNEASYQFSRLEQEAVVEKLQHGTVRLNDTNLLMLTSKLVWFMVLQMSC